MANPRETVFPPDTVVRIGGSRLTVLEWCADGSLVGLEPGGETVFLPVDHLRDMPIYKGGLIDIAYEIEVAASEATREAAIAELHRQGERERERFAKGSGAPALGPEEVESFLERFATEAR